MFGPEVRDVLSAADSTTISVGAGATVYTKSMSLRYGKYFAVAYKAAAAGAINLSLDWEQSFEEPDTEGAADAKWCVGESTSAIDSSIITDGWIIASFAPLAMPYIRFKIISSAAGTNTIQIKFGMQEDI